MKKKKNIKSRLNKMLEVPDEIVEMAPRVTVLNFEKMTIENYKGILEYQDFFVRVKTSIGIININGYGLSLEEMTIDDLVVKGKIESIDFEGIEDNREQ